MYTGGTVGGVVPGLLLTFVPIAVGATVVVVDPDEVDPGLFGTVVFIGVGSVVVVVGATVTVGSGGELETTVTTAPALWALTGVPNWSIALAVATLVRPEVTSLSEQLYGASLAPTANVPLKAALQFGASESVTLTLVRSVLPVFITVIDQVAVPPEVTV